jgi:hypothetical protein
MRALMILVGLVGSLLMSLPAQAQAASKLSSLQVQLWPEYDQPSMLVIYDFSLPANAQLPLNVSLRFPQDANLVAVASQAQDGSLLNTDYQGPTPDADWQVISLQIQTPAVYHVEYYEPLTRDGNARHFSYLWPGDYSVDDFVVSVRLPMDATGVSADPSMQLSQSSDGTPYLRKDFGGLAAQQQFPIQLTYTRTSESLTATQQTLQPSQPLGASTPGRIVWSRYLPYVFAFLGIALILGGGAYVWQSSRAGGRAKEGRRSHGGGPKPERGPEVYCHNCGTRALSGDRFCRVCGTKLRQSVE